MRVLTIKVTIWKKSGNLFNDPRTSIRNGLYEISWKFSSGEEEVIDKSKDTTNAKILNNSWFLLYNNKISTLRFFFFNLQTKI